VFKKLDILIIKAFIGPFIATFFITLVVLVMQFFWLYIDDFVGKGLGPDIVLRFIWYQSAVLVPLAMPLAILLSSLMTFGNLGESFELVAIKSAGISLLRFMRPLLIVATFLSAAAFMFSNFIIPVAWLNSRTMLSDIVYAKPAFDLKEGVFYDKINDFVIKIVKKEANDFNRVIKRVLYKDLETVSPYNTYRNFGLPPGPIAMPDVSAIDAVLNPEKHNYIYFCASVTNFGYHEFAVTPAQHEVNRQKYVAWVNKQGIKR